MSYLDLAASSPSASLLLGLSTSRPGLRNDIPSELPSLSSPTIQPDCYMLDRPTEFAVNDGSLVFEEDEGLGDVELCSPVEERAAALQSARGRETFLISSPRWSSQHVNVFSSDNPCDFQASQSQGLMFSSNMSSAAFSPDPRSVPVGIVTPGTANCKATTNQRLSQVKEFSVRESLLDEAWERKRDLMLNDELSTMKEKTKPEQLGRSVSDCGQLPCLQTPATKVRPRTRSLTDEDFEELRGFMDLGFQFNEHCIPDLCATLPALEVYYAVTQKNLHDSPCCMSPVSTLHGVSELQSPGGSLPSPWRVVSPGDQPQVVKARLRHWAQAVACTVRSRTVQKCIAHNGGNLNQS